MKKDHQIVDEIMMFTFVDATDKELLLVHGYDFDTFRIVQEISKTDDSFSERINWLDKFLEEKHGN